MKNEILKCLIALLKVKSLITILTFFVFAYLSINDRIDTENFMLILGMISTYFFNKDKKGE